MMHPCSGKNRTKPIRPPTEDENIRFNLGITKYHNDPNLKQPDFMSDGCIWETAHQGDDEPFYCMYNLYTGAVHIVKNQNDIWSVVPLDKMSQYDLYGLIHKMLYSIRRPNQFMDQTMKIIVNGKTETIANTSLTYEALIQLAGYDSNINYSMMYSIPGTDIAASVCRGKTVELKNGMCFSICLTNCA